MILAEKITKLRKQQGWSQEELAARLDVSRQAVSKWESMASMPDLDKILKMSALFDVSTDYLLKDDVLEEPACANTNTEPETILHPVSLYETNTFLTLSKVCGRRIALAVSLCIVSPILLILLAGASEQGYTPFREDVAAALGLCALILLVAAAVAIFLLCGLKLAPYEYMEKEAIATEYGVAGIVETKKEAFAPSYRLGLVVGILLCVISVLPLFISMALEQEFLTICAVCLMLLFIAIGVYLIVRVVCVWSSYQKLLEEEEYTREKKAENKRNDPFSSFYWCLVTALYLGISFFTNAWDRTWIIWPVAGVLFAAILAFKQMLTRSR